MRWPRRETLFEKILLGRDGSDAAQRAIEAAAEIAVMSTGELHIASADAPESFTPASSGEEFETVNTEGDVNWLLQMLSFIAKKYGIEPTLHPSYGDPAEALVSIADELGTDLIVVGDQA